MASLHYSGQKIMSKGPFLLSVVATSRNDNHGKNLLYRMQCFVDGFIAQCKRHNLRAELILVEWNPPSDTLPLAQALRFPTDKGPCSIRIIRVPSEVHLKLNHATKIPLFQMIGKNVGIRRALGRFVLATNIDILFSDKIIKFMKHRLTTGHLYRVDRLDVPEELPPTQCFDNILRFCSKNFFRINSRTGTYSVIRRTLKQRVISKLKTWIERAYLKLKGLKESVSLKPLYPIPLLLIKKIIHLSLFSLFMDLKWLITSVSKAKWLITLASKAAVNTAIYTSKKTSKAFKIFKNISKRLLCFAFPNSPLILHTNACGDFTLLSFEDWKNLKGYPEWNIFSWHLDSVLLYQARQHGIKERTLPTKMPIFHIEHGSGFSPEGADQLFQRLDSKGIPYLSCSDLKKLVTQLHHSETKVTYNDDNWGMADIELEEIII